MKWLIIPIFSLISWGVASLTQDNRIKIAVVDTGVNVTKTTLPYMCYTGHYAVQAGEDPLRDDNGHGTNVVSLLVRDLDPSKYCIQMIKYCAHDCIKNTGTIYKVKALERVLFNNVSYLNISLAGGVFYKSERDILLKALNAGIKIAVAAGNHHTNLDEVCNEWPACYTFNRPNFHVVGSSTAQNGQIYSNYGHIVKHYENGTKVGTPVMTGTSQATAIHLNHWILKDAAPTK